MTLVSRSAGINSINTIDSIDIRSSISDIHLIDIVVSIDNK